MICEKCKEKVKISEEIERTLWPPGQAPEKTSEVKYIFKGKGCKLCNNTGYLGRTGIYEILLVNNEIKKLIVQRPSSDVIKEKAIEMGMRTLRLDGWEKVLAGITTVEEVLRVTQMEE